MDSFVEEVGPHCYRLLATYDTSHSGRRSGERRSELEQTATGLVVYLPAEGPDTPYSPKIAMAGAAG